MKEPRVANFVGRKIEVVLFVTKERVFAEIDGRVAVDEKDPGSLVASAASQHRRW